MTRHFDGGCACGQVRYRMTSEPMFVHCCHCRDCQRQTGSAFVLNALIEADRVTRLEGAPEPVPVGTLDDPSALAPDVHIYTRSKLPWVVLPAGVPAFEAYYEMSTLWPAASLARRRMILGPHG